jgi:hypothetical protein
MAMDAGPGRTYRYYTGTPVWAFGEGLSYTTFSIEWSPAPPDAPVAVDAVARYTATVTNTGLVGMLCVCCSCWSGVFMTAVAAGDEVVLAFVSTNSTGAPLRQLFGFQRVHLEPGTIIAYRFIRR